MKKTIIFLLQVVLFTTFINLKAFGAEIDTSNWYLYNGYSTLHSFSVKFPTNWQARTFGDDLQGFAPENYFEDVYFQIKEYEGLTYDQAIEEYLNGNVELISVEDFIHSNGDDTIAKKVVYQNKTTGDEINMTFIKRGSLIISLSDPNTEKYSDIVQGIHDSFTFTDSWHQYIDFGNKYSFIFPSSLEVENVSDGVVISDPAHFNSPIFTVLKYENVSVDNAPQEAEGADESLEETKDILFHGIEGAVSARYLDEEENKMLSRIFVEKDGSSFSMTNVNIESNFPHLNYYDEYIIEILESFEFFDIEGEYSAFKYFPDVREDHQNQQAINSLTELEVIAGYPDGLFRPDGEINRAELTKMIVATKVTPKVEDYNNCFPDVRNEWFAPFVCYAYEQEWVVGYPDGRFRPEQNINRVEAIKIILEVLIEELDENETLNNTSVLDIDSEDWYSKYFTFADNRNLLDKQHILEEGGDYYYFPDLNISRKEVAETIYRSLNL